MLSIKRLSLADAKIPLMVQEKSEEIGVPMYCRCDSREIWCL